MSKVKGKAYNNILFLLIIIIFITTTHSNTLYNFPIDIFSHNYLPMIPIYFKYYSSLPKFMVLDINADKSWIFKPESNEQNDNNEIINYDFYTLLGNKNKETLYLDSDTKIEDFNFFKISQIKGDNYFPGALSLNKNMNEYNFANKLKYEENNNNIINNKYFGFCLDFNFNKGNKEGKEGKLSIGNMNDLNNDISKLIRLPLYEDNEEGKNKKEKINSKWAIKLNGIFIGKINKTLTDKKIIENNNNDKKTIYNINRKYNKGLIIDESANIETIYNSIYVTKKAMLFLVANYFKGKENVCVRQECNNNDESNYEIKYNCYKNKKNKLKNINIILDNNITLELTPDDLLNCAINHNLKPENNAEKEMCEFNIKYHQNIDHYILGLSVFKKYKTYFLFNDKSILLEGDNFSNSYLKKNKFSNISRNNKKSIGETIKELFSTTICISFIFAFLAGSFYLYERFNGKIEYLKLGEKIINRDKYNNL